MPNYFTQVTHPTLVSMIQTGSRDFDTCDVEPRMTFVALYHFCTIICKPAYTVDIYSLNPWWANLSSTLAADWKWHHVAVFKTGQEVLSHSILIKGRLL